MEQPVRILISSRDYNDWYFVNHETNLLITDEIPHIDPGLHKLFTKDVVRIKKESSIKVDILVSPIRTLKYIAGILMLDGNKTYGRTENKKRLLYKCIPDDKHLPAFLVPYDIKIDFSKVNENKYIIFKYDNWNDKHPRGTLLECLGNISDLNVFYEYQLYCKSLHISLTNFTKKTREYLNKSSLDEYMKRIFENPNYQIEDRQNEYIFTIDPQNSQDFDDGFSIVDLPNNKYKVTVYIANVYFWMDILDLWDSFSKRVATIYLPDQRRPMLPTILSDNLCSLQKGQQRFAFAMDIIVDNEGNIFDNEVIFKNVLIKVKKNYVYEQYIDDKYYDKLIEITQKIDKTVKDSHDLVSHWMITMNQICGKWFDTHNIGIFRTSVYRNQFVPIDSIDESLNVDTIRVIKQWNNVSGQYILHNGENMIHEVMKKSSYIHITSPIRRIVDLLNQIIMINKLGLIKNISDSGSVFLENWLQQMDYINSSMRSIRKVQTDCNVLYRCYNDSSIMDNVQKGIIFDKNEKIDGIYTYMVYLDELKLLSRITTINNFENYSRVSCKLYLFEDEDKIKKKIRLQIIEN
jgi:exoribonuclease R